MTEQKVKEQKGLTLHGESPEHVTVLPYTITVTTAGPLRAEALSTNGCAGEISVTSNVTSVSSAEVMLAYQNSVVYAGTAQGFIQKVYENPSRIISVLVEAIKSLRRTQEYNGVYTAFLLGQLSDEEFAEEAEKYSFVPETCYSDEIRSKAEILLRVINETISASELSDIFKIDEGVAEQVLAEISAHLETEGRKISEY